MTIAHHVANLESPFHDDAIQARCLLNGLSQEEQWAGFRAKYHDFINTGEVGDMLITLVGKEGHESACYRS